METLKHPSQQKRPIQGPLTLLELENLSIDQIKTLAANQREPFIKSEARLSPKAHDLFNEHSEKVTTWLSARKEKFEAGKLKPMADDPPCIKRLLESGAKKGNRNNVTFQLAVFYASKGLSQDEIEKLCTQYTAKSEEPLTPHRNLCTCRFSLHRIHRRPLQCRMLHVCRFM
jgi:hypothetical protein